MAHDDDPTASYAGYGPYWNPGTDWGTPATGPDGNLFPHGYDTGPSLPHDGDLEKIIGAAIHRDPTIPADSEISIHVANGAVTLTGTVPTSSAKRAAGDAAWYAPGVTDVHNDIIVKSHATS